MKNTIEFLNNCDNLADIINIICEQYSAVAPFEPIKRDWIDRKNSADVTKAFMLLTPEETPYISNVLVENNPDTLYEGTCVDDNSKRHRYFVVTVVPDTKYPFNHSYPLIHSMQILGLACWEMVRAVLAAAREDMRTKIVEIPVPPILNNARIEWISIYLGRKPYDGIIQLKDMMDADSCDAMSFYNVHLFNARESEPNDLIQRLLDAYNLDFPEDLCDR